MMRYNKETGEMEQYCPKCNKRIRYIKKEYYKLHSQTQWCNSCIDNFVKVFKTNEANVHTCMNRMGV